jgi:hypothetical protein
MPPDRTAPEEKVTALVIGSGAFLEGRLVRVLEIGGFEVHRKVDLSRSYVLGLVELPGGPEVALLFSSGVHMIGVEEISPGEMHSEPSWPFEDVIHNRMSAEDILQIANDVYYRNRGTRRHRRIPVSLDIVVVGENRVLRTTTANLSEGGTFVRSLNPFPRQSSVRLRLVQDQTLEEVSGQVVYTIGLEGDSIVHEDDPTQPVVAHPGMAVMFSDGQKDVIHRWMRMAQLRLETAAFYR